MSRKSKRTSAPPPQAVPPCSQPAPSQPSLQFLDHVPGVHRIHRRSSRHHHPRPTRLPDYSNHGWWDRRRLKDPGRRLLALVLQPPRTQMYKHVHAQGLSHGSSFKPIHVGDDTNIADCGRTHVLWTKDEDRRLVGAWLNNSNDPIHSNYKKNDQYWKEVVAAYNSGTSKNQARQLKHIKDLFGRIKKRVAWFCGSWKETSALWASGESDVDLMDKELKLYEEEHKNDGPFMFMHCWDIYS
ncbi:hypothetical protein PVAP13_2KG266900 [Panicum virgatum]|uniref:Uncharacterized protein n=1 Tax=Panicum virgatum TaxID=38727 RepID=A0A8T0WBJ3_PANVG|nr:hypothetical protein PVAP13_2KG266900 [Panicum virgatum]